MGLRVSVERYLNINKQDVQMFGQIQHIPNAFKRLVRKRYVMLGIFAQTNYNFRCICCKGVCLECLSLYENKIYDFEF